jgi:hypothetical protein
MMMLNSVGHKSPIYVQFFRVSGQLKAVATGWLPPTQQLKVQLGTVNFATLFSLACSLGGMEL